MNDQDKYDDYTLMTFGKWKNEILSNIPADYLLFMGRQLKQKDRLREDERKLLEYIDDNDDVLQKEFNEQKRYGS